MSRVDPTTSVSAPLGTEHAQLLAELVLLFTPGLGSVLASRFVERFGSAQRAASVSETDLQSIAGIGKGKAASIRRGLIEAQTLAERELERAAALGVTLVTIDDPRYPTLLRSIPNPPRLLFLRGQLPRAQQGADPGTWHGLGIVGSRRCTAYGIEQAERFAAAIASAGITIVSGGARGIDTASHRASLRVRGSTVAVLGCGLAHDYPPENRDLFDRIAGEGGAVVSELPLDTPPAADNFPARNRIISGMSLGVLVIEAPKRSGSLITAREASENQGREVMALPGRVDSPASAGSLELIRDGAALITCPADVINTLETAARHHFAGTHAVFTGQLFKDDQQPHRASSDDQQEKLDDHHPDQPASSGADHSELAATPPPTDDLTRILQSCRQGNDPDTIARDTGIAAHRVRAQLTMLELTGRVKRQGTRFTAANPS